MKRLFWLLLLLATGTSFATECSHNEFELEAARRADTVILFTVTSARLDDPATDAVVADINVVRVIRGRAGKAIRIRYFGVPLHCGSHIDVGGRYFGFGSLKQGVLDVHVGNLLSIVDLEPNVSFPTVDEVEKMLSEGQELPENVLRFSKRHVAGYHCLEDICAGR